MLTRGPLVYAGYHPEIKIEILDMTSHEEGPTSKGVFTPVLPYIDGARPKLHPPRLAELGHLSRCLDIEFLDDPSLPEDAVARAHRELQRTHRWLGNTAAVLHLLRQDPLPIRSVLASAAAMAPFF